MRASTRKLPWRRIGALVGIAHDALYHQYASGGPVVTVSPFYRRESRNMQTTTQLARGHEQSALHQRVAQIGTIPEFLRWFDAVRAGTEPTVRAAPSALR
jgi:hypothetical protein